MPLVVTELGIGMDVRLELGTKKGKAIFVVVVVVVFCCCCCFWPEWHLAGGGGGGGGHDFLFLLLCSLIFHIALKKTPLCTGPLKFVLRCN